jgi:ABC-type iron transport system FetAB permease component
VKGTNYLLSLNMLYCSKHAPILETRLAYGASRLEAARPLAVESIRLALLPVITQLSVIGLINIPGVMVGLLLAGSPIRDAVIYQQVIMFMVVASSTFGSILAVGVRAHLQGAKRILDSDIDIPTFFSTLIGLLECRN